MVLNRTLILEPGITIVVAVQKRRKRPSIPESTFLRYRLNHLSTLASCGSTCTIWRRSKIRLEEGEHNSYTELISSTVTESQNCPIPSRILSSGRNGLVTNSEVAILTSVDFRFSEVGKVGSLYSSNMSKTSSKCRGFFSYITPESTSLAVGGKRRRNYSRRHSSSSDPKSA